MASLGYKAFVLANELPRSAAELGGPEPSAAVPMEVTGMKGRTILTATVGVRGGPGRKPHPWQVPGWKTACSTGKQEGERGKMVFFCI